MLPVQPHFDTTAGQARPVGPEAEGLLRRAGGLVNLFEAKVRGATWDSKGCLEIHLSLHPPAPSSLFWEVLIFD